MIINYLPFEYVCVCVFVELEGEDFGIYYLSNLLLFYMCNATGLRYLALIPAFLWFREQYELRKELKKLVRIILSKLNYDDKDVRTLLFLLTLRC